MNSFQLKLLAVVTMVIDHIGAEIFPELPIFRIIGRLAFPIFCFLISEGCFYSKDMKKYLGRLFLFALLSEIPYDLAFSQQLFSFDAQNVFFTLFAGALSVYLLKTWLHTRPVITVALIAAISVLDWFLHSDYSVFGIAFVIIFYYLRKKKVWGLASFTLANVVCSIVISYVQLYATAACVPLAFYNGKKGKYSFKYFFYLFYPLHLLAIYFVLLILK